MFLGLKNLNLKCNEELRLPCTVNVAECKATYNGNTQVKYEYKYNALKYLYTLSVVTVQSGPVCFTAVDSKVAALRWNNSCLLRHCRFGPRQIRAESALLRACNSGTRAAPYESLMVADIGDVNVNMYDLKDTCKRIREAYRKILATGCVPLTMGESN